MINQAQASVDDVIDGSLTVEQEKMFWRDQGRIYFLIAASLKKESALEHLNKVRSNPNKETYDKLIYFLIDMLENVDYEYWPEKSEYYSEKLFFSGKFMAKGMLIESLDIDESNIESIFSQRYLGLIDDIALQN